MILCKIVFIATQNFISHDERCLCLAYADDDEGDHNDDDDDFVNDL